MSFWASGRPYWIGDKCGVNRTRLALSQNFGGRLASWIRSGGYALAGSWSASCRARDASRLGPFDSRCRAGIRGRGPRCAEAYTMQWAESVCMSPAPLHFFLGIRHAYGWEDRVVLKTILLITFVQQEAVHLQRLVSLQVKSAIDLHNTRTVSYTHLTLPTKRIV